MTISIIGLGLIGGSLALDLRAQMQLHVLGVDKNIQHQALSIQLGLVDEIVSLSDAINRSDVIIIAIPVDKIETVLTEIMNSIQPHQVVIDVGSTKEAICRSIAHHSARSRYVACHPLAGTEFSGPTAAQRGLFSGKKNIICHQELSDGEAVKLARQLFESVGMQSYHLSAVEHDMHLAYVSHLSHVTSFTLGKTVLDIEKDQKQIFNLASTGFASTARLAKSNPQTWTAIFKKNSPHLVKAIDEYMEHLKQFRDAIADEDVARMQEMMKEANDIGKII